MTNRLGGALLAGVLLAAALAAPPTIAVAAPADRPNVVLILTDDMRLDDLRYMRYTRKLFREEGTSFQHVLSPHPLCCPARAELLTGQYGQNNGVLHNDGPWGGYPALEDPQHTMPQWFQDSGYRTAYVGKFVNGYHGGEIPGLTVNDATVKNVYRPRGVTSWNNGNPVKRTGHQTIWTAKRTVELVHQFKGDPFFVWAGYVAPHAMLVAGSWRPPVPPRRFDELQQRRDGRPQSFDSPAYNEEDVSDKPAAIRKRPLVANKFIRTHHRSRVLSLYAVDAGVRRTVAGLKAAGVYENTILVFASDNGFTLGEHRTSNKNLPYQESVRIPYLMTGPGVPAGRVDTSVGTLVDVPVTLARLAGVTPTRTQDGVDLFAGPRDRAVLIQAGGFDAPWRWRGVYTARYTVAWHANGETELYDRLRDPFELRSVHRRSGYSHTLAQLRALYDSRLEDCAAADCVARAP